MIGLKSKSRKHGFQLWQATVMLVLFLLPGCGTPRFASREKSESADFSRDENDSAAWKESNQTRPQEASSLIGRAVRNLRNEKLGRVTDFVIDLKTQKILAAVISPPFFSATGREKVQIPPDLLTLHTDGKTLIFNIDKEQFARIPNAGGNEAEEQPVVSGPSRQISDTAQKGSKDPLVWNAKETPKLSTKNDIFDATKLIGTPVRSRQGQSLGKVKDLLLDLPGGRLDRILISSRAGQGMAEELHWLPSTVFSPDAIEGILVVKTDSPNP